MHSAKTVPISQQVREKSQILSLKSLFKKLRQPLFLTAVKIPPAVDFETTVTGFIAASGSAAFCQNRQLTKVVSGSLAESMSTSTKTATARVLFLAPFAFIQELPA